MDNHTIHTNVINITGMVVNMNLDPKTNRKRIKRLMADIGIDYDVIAMENKIAVLQYKANRLLVEVGLRKVRQEPCKWN